MLPLAIILSYFGSLPFGMINLNVLYAELTKGRKAAVLMATGAAIVEFIQGVVAAIVYGRLVILSTFELYFKYAAMVVFFGLAFYYFFKKKKSAELENQTLHTTKTPFYHGLGLSSLNFMAVPFWLIILAMISSYVDIYWTTSAYLLFGLGAGLGGFLASMTYAILGNKLVKKDSKVYKYLDYILALLFLGLGILALFYS